MIRADAGFTAVELLVALVVGMLLLGSAYQLHTTVLKDSGDSQRRSQASNVAYDLLRQYQANSAVVTKPCTTTSTNPAVPAYANLPGSSATVTVSCPYGTASNLSLVTVTLTYNNSNGTAQVTRAITTRPS